MADETKDKQEFKLTSLIPVYEFSCSCGAKGLTSEGKGCINCGSVTLHEDAVDNHVDLVARDAAKVAANDAQANTAGGK